eukprot:m.23786 g.23786  ORF g.23786 m.23786 type:complete len:1092 (+) comp11091_c0_seq2:190-3465(+)
MNGHSGASSNGSEVDNRDEFPDLGLLATVSDEEHQQRTQQQMLVEEELRKKDVFSESRIKEETTFYFAKLGLPRRYFFETSVEDIARHIQCLQAARILAANSGNPFDITLKQEYEDSAFFASRSYVETRHEKGRTLRMEFPVDQVTPLIEVERYVEDRYLTGHGNRDPILRPAFQRQMPKNSISYHPESDVDAKKEVYRLQCYRSTGVLENQSGTHMRFYFLKKPDFVNKNPADGEWRLEQLGDTNFLASTNAQIKGLYQDIMKESVETMGPVIKLIPNYASEEETLVMVAHHIGSTHSYFTGIPDVYRYYYFYAPRKYVEPFSNNVVIFVFHLRPLDWIQTQAGKREFPTSAIEARHSAIQHDLSLHFVLPRTSLTPLLRNSALSAQQVAYAYAAWKFAFHFIKRGIDEYTLIANLLRRSHPDALPTLSRLRVTLKMHAFTEGSLRDIILSNVDAVVWLYADFAARHLPRAERQGLLSEKKFNSALSERFKTDIEGAIFTAFYLFNKSITKTNFYRSGKTALCFRLHPSFLPPSEYSETPHSVFFLVGSEFRGFLVRFNEIARGPVQMIHSKDNQDFAQNLVSCFDECYYHAAAQHKKNKDVAEGGAWGSILLHVAHADKARIAFRKYIDSLLDLLLRDDSIQCVPDEKEEMLFFGPDEGTAAYMDWATSHAKKRGYRHWRTITCGRSPAFGGICDDAHGLNSLGIRAFIQGLQARTARVPQQCTMTVLGSPSKQCCYELSQNRFPEKIVTMMDGAALAHDPDGLCKEELQRLAMSGKMLDAFDPHQLSARGFVVPCQDIADQPDLPLPDGRIIRNRNKFCSDFLLAGNSGSDFFVAYEGKMASVTNQNVARFAQATLKTGMKRKGASDSPAMGPAAAAAPGPGPGPGAACKYSFFIEGCNLFFTQDARIALESNGAHVIRDASASMGQVTAASFEILAGFALSEQQYMELMVVQNDQPSEFHRRYVSEVQQLIVQKATAEFDFLWREKEKMGTPMCVASDRLGSKVCELTLSVMSSSVWKNEMLKRKVLQEIIPRSLQDLVGLDALLATVPETFLHAMFSSHLASAFVYQYGFQPSEIMFYEFIHNRYM